MAHTACEIRKDLLARDRSGARDRLFDNSLEVDRIETSKAGSDAFGSIIIWSLRPQFLHQVCHPAAALVVKVKEVKVVAQCVGITNTGFQAQSSFPSKEIDVFNRYS